MTSFNRSVWITTMVTGITVAVAGFHHGLFETLQGNQPTEGIGIHSIGPQHVRWEHGTDDAVTVIPNFLATGLAAMAVSLGIMGWCVSGLRQRHGPAVFLALFILLTLVGGGMGHILFFLTAWAYSTRMRSSLSWWRRRLGSRARRVWARFWIHSMGLSVVCFLIAMELSVFGFPIAAVDADSLLLVIWGLLLISLVLINTAYAGAIARDIDPMKPQR